MLQSNEMYSSSYLDHYLKMYTCLSLLILGITFCMKFEDLEKTDGFKDITKLRISEVVYKFAFYISFA